MEKGRECGFASPVHRAWGVSAGTKGCFVFIPRHAGSLRVAVRVQYPASSNLYYLMGDHLGSTSVSYESVTHQFVRERYKAWGELRDGGNDLPTNYTYTGQYSYTASFGLMFYGAMWYDSSLGRFAQADTIIPGAGN